MSELDDRPLGRARDRGPDAERLFRTALELVSSGVVLADGDGRIVLANQQVEHQFGYPHGELIGQRMDVLVPDALRMASGSESAAGLRAPKAAPPAPMPICSDSAGTVRGSRSKSRSGTLRTEDGCFVLASVGDVTAQRQQEQAHRDAVTEPARIRGG